MEDNNQEMYELYARLTVKKLEEIAVRGDARAHFYAGNKNKNSALIKIETINTLPHGYNRQT